MILEAFFISEWYESGLHAKLSSMRLILLMKDHLSANFKFVRCVHLALVASGAVLRQEKGGKEESPYQLKSRTTALQPLLPR